MAEYYKKRTIFVGNSIKKHNYSIDKNRWKEFLVSKGFYIQYEDESFVHFIGCHPEIRIELYSGDYRTVQTMELI